MIGHRRMKRRLPDLLEGDLLPKDRERIEKHLLRCEDCRKEAAELKGLLRRLKDQPLPMPDPAFWATFPTRVRLAVDREKTRMRENKARIPILRWRSFGWVPLAAAAVLLVLGLGWILMRETGSRPSRPEWASMNPEAVVTELSGADQALLHDVLTSETAEEDWMEELAGMTDQEMEGILMAGFSLEESVLSDPELLREIYEEERT